MAVNTIEPMRNKSANTDRGPTPAVWADCPVLELLENPGLGTYDFEDFCRGGLITAPTTEAALVGLNISGFSSTASQIAFLNTVYTNTVQDAGRVTLFETTDNEATSIRSASVPYRMSAGFGKLWFEARIKVASVATLENSFFVGLMEDTALTVAVPITTTSTLADKNLVGFFKPEANTTTYNTSYKADGVTAVNVNTGVGALVADTYVKLGFKFDPNDSNKLRFYIDGVEQANTKTIPSNTGTDFPADVALGWVIAMAVGSAASDNTLTCDWIRVAQLFL
jgi:hypothetical protein